jgi:hypothetical protein
MYVFLIAKSIFKLQEINKILDILLEYLNSAKPIQSHYGLECSLSKNPNYDTCLNEVLAHYPVIQKYSDFYAPHLEYGASDISTFTSAAKIYNNFLMKRNYLFQDFKDSFNPIYTLKALFSVPSRFLKWIGLTHKLSFPRLFNLLCWVVAYFINLYSDEIKALIASIFEHLV